MNLAHVPVRIRTGDTIRIDTRRCLVGPPRDEGRVFTDKASGTERLLTHHAILHMIRAGRITTDAAYRALDPNVLANLQVDWGAFSDIEQESALCKHPFVKAVDGLPLPQRDRGKEIRKLIDGIMKDPKHAHRLPKPPSVRRVRTWYRRWLVAGRDIRALVDNHRKKGNRTPKLKPWQKEKIADAINETYRNAIAGSKADAQRLAEDRIRIGAEDEGEELPNLGAKNGVLGKNAVARVIAGMELYDLTCARHGKAEADFVMKAVRAGPQVSLPLEEAEVDHTQLDLIVVDEHGRVLGRPWLTVIIDRRTRMILGFSLTFTPPSWVSVMEALRIAVRPKKDLLESVASAVGAAAFRSPWPCQGSMSRLFCDNGPEFRSASMRATEAALNMQVVDLPRASGWLKGRVESWFKTLNKQLIHKLPGTTKSNPRARGNYRSEKEATLTIADANWAIAKWIVDVYHTEVHSGTGEIPLTCWMREIAEIGEKPAPAEEVLAPLTGLIVPRKLRPTGVQHLTLRWNSNAFSALRNRLGGNADVEVRIDPYDLRTAYILDPTRTDDRDAWIEGHLESNPEAADYTLYQWETLRKARDADAAAEAFDRDGALARARSRQEILDFARARSKPGKLPPKETVRFVTDGRNASEHLRGERFSPAESEDEIGSHDHRNRKLKSPPPDERGPWRDRTRALEPPREGSGPPVPPVDVAAVERAADGRDDDPAPDGPPTPRRTVTVRRRKTR